MKSFNKFRIESLTQIDELNKDTLRSYANKAEKDQDKQFTTIGKGIRDNDPNSANKAGHKFSKRSAGLNRAEKRLGEEKDPEYSDPYMAVNQLKTIMHNAEEMIELIGDDTDLPEWVESKITLAEDYVMTVANYMRSELKEEKSLRNSNPCWTGYHPVGTKKKNGRTVPNCVPEEVEEIFDEIEELFMEIAEANSVDPEVIWEHYEDVSDEELFETAAWRRKEGKDPKGGLNRKGIASYRRENPGSKLSMAVTTKPSKLKPGSKAANRRKSFCARMGGMPGPMKKPNGEPSRKALALRKWNC
jgi:hypothetical protein